MSSVISQQLTNSCSGSLGSGCKGDSACALLVAIITPDIICGIDLPSFEAIGLYLDSQSRHKFFSYQANLLYLFRIVNSDYIIFRGGNDDPECRGRIEGTFSGVRYEPRSPRRVRHVLEAAVHEFLRERDDGQKYIIMSCSI